MELQFDIVKRCLDTFYKKFRKQPLNFLYESDVRSLLFSELFEALCGSPICLSVGPIQHKGSKNLIDAGKPQVALNPVKSEYPTSFGGRFDIALLDPRSEPSVALWSKPVRLAIEIKLWQVDGSGGSVKNDLKKLRHYWLNQQKNDATNRFTGIALLLCHSHLPKSSRNDLKELEVGLTQEKILPENGFALHVMKEESWVSAEISDRKIASF